MASPHTLSRGASRPVTRTYSSPFLSPILRWNIIYDGAEVREAENLSRTGEAVLLRLFSGSGGGLWHKPQSPVVAEAAASGGEELRQREISISPVTARETAEMRVCFGLSW
jgi:hypothetical protein